jgi:hypothetical protein
VPFERFKAEAKKRGKKIEEPENIQNTDNKDILFMEEFLDDKEVKKLAHKVGLPETAPRREILDALKQQKLHTKLMTPEEPIVLVDKFKISFDSRPEFTSEQIKELSQIKIGERYQEYHLDRTDPHMGVPMKRLTFVVLSEPYEKNGSWWVRIKKQGSRGEDEVDLADYGILPYKGGHWNIANWIEVI